MSSILIGLMVAILVGYSLIVTRAILLWSERYEILARVCEENSKEIKRLSENQKN